MIAWLGGGVPQIRHSHSQESTLHTPQSHSHATHSFFSVHTHFFWHTVIFFRPHSCYPFTLSASLSSGLTKVRLFCSSCDTASKQQTTSSSSWSLRAPWVRDRVFREGKYICNFAICYFFFADFYYCNHIYIGLEPTVCEPTRFIKNKSLTSPIAIWTSLRR